MDTTKFDDILMGMLQHCEQVEPFLDAMFSFLARRTDFFRVMHSRDEKMGFPPGVAEKIVLKIFKRYQEVVEGNQTEKKSVKKGKLKATGDVAKATSTKQTSSVDCTTSETEPPPTVASVEVKTDSDAQSEAQMPLPGPACSDLHATSTSSSQPKEENRSDDSKGLVPGKSADCYNGAVLDRYSWSQTIRDIEVKIPLPSSVTKARDVGVEIKSSYLKVWLKKDVSPVTGSNVLVEGKLQRSVKCEESMWLLEGGKFVVVNLEKREERFWTAIIEGDAEIDKSKVDTTRDISDFDEQTQSDFQRVMYDHHQKLQGKPTSQEAKTHELLKQAWNAKGSPFAGTEFDPSKVNISPSYG